MITENTVYRVETMGKRICTEYDVFRKCFSKKKEKKVFLFLILDKAELLLRIIVYL